MDSKKVLEKLVKIAENQQKIIMKLAQSQGLEAQPLGGAADSWVDVTSQVASVLAKIPGAAQLGIGLSYAKAGPQSGALDGKVKIKMNQLGDPKVEAILKQLKQTLAGTSVTDAAGKPVQLSQNPADLKLISET
jgi:hypothetical protein